MRSTAVRFRPLQTGFTASVCKVTELLKTERLCITLLTLLLASTKGIADLYPSRDQAHPITRAVGVSHTTCKDETRRNPRSHSCSYSSVLLIINQTPSDNSTTGKRGRFVGSSQCEKQVPRSFLTSILPSFLSSRRKLSYNRTSRKRHYLKSRRPS